MKFLPLDISAFSELITENYIYIDKTESIYKLYATGKRFHFLARPRRFGKSLLLSTLKELFSANRELFKGLWIDQDGFWEWKKFPVIYLDMSRAVSGSAEGFSRRLSNYLIEVGSDLGVHLDYDDSEVLLDSLIVKLYKKYGKVVVLIDEYDKPFLDTISVVDDFQERHKVLKLFYDTFKGHNERLRAIFVTGISKFGLTSIFSGFNNVSDISLSPEAASIVGYTKDEIKDYFKERLVTRAAEWECSVDALFKKIEEWYNGYRFSYENTLVFNPISVLKFFDSGLLGDYWFTTGTPSFLIPFIKKYYASLIDFTQVQVTSSELVTFDIEGLSIEALLFQAGYLTLSSYDRETFRYTLKIPNREVKDSLAFLVLVSLTASSTNQVNRGLNGLVSALQKNDLEIFFQILQILLVHIPYEIHIKEEAYYHSLFYFLGILLNLRIDAELLTDKGRIDLVVATKTHIYLMELKINSTPAAALKQIHDKKYYERFMGDPRVIILVGLNFTTKHSSLTIEWEKEEMPTVGASSNVF